MEAREQRIRDRGEEQKIKIWPQNRIVGKEQGGRQNKAQRTQNKGQTIADRRKKVEDKKQGTEKEKWKTGHSVTDTLTKNRKERIEDKEERREIDNRE